jgi:hypothetical protein
MSRLSRKAGTSQTPDHRETAHTPAVRLQKSPGVLLDERNRFQSVRHHHETGRFRVLFLGPLDPHNHEAVGKGLAFAGSAFLLGVDHHGIRAPFMVALTGQAMALTLVRHREG